MEKVEHHTEVSGVRLRQPERLQVEWTARCPDELIPADHQVRIIWQVCESQDLSEFCQPIKARAQALRAKLTRN